MSPGRFAVFSMTVPPARRAQAILLERVLKRVPPDRYIWVSNEGVGPGTVAQQRYLVPNAQTTARQMEDRAAGNLERVLGRIRNPLLLRALRPVLGGYRWTKTQFGRLRARFNNHDTIIAARAARLERIIETEQISLLVACTGGNVYNLPAAYLAAQRTGIPLIAYMFDYYSREAFVEQAVARKWEPVILPSAAAVIVINEGLRDAYRNLYDLDSIVIYNPCVLDVPVHEREHYFDKDVFNIVYTGAIWSVYYDGFRRLARAVNQLGGKAQLHIFTGNPSFVLRLQGIDGPHVVFHTPLPPDEIRQVQREADLLVIPLSFEAGFRELVNVVSATKLGEYLASGRAILIHAPDGAFLNRYFHQHECGIVVDQPDTNALVAALQCLLADDALRAALGQRARARAEADFDVEKISKRFMHVLESTTRFRFS